MADRFSEGLAAVYVEDKGWGYINDLGEMLIPPRFDKAAPFSEGLAMVKIKKKYGYIDQVGNVVIEPRFDCHQYDCEDLWFYEIDGQWYIPPQFGWGSFNEGLAQVLLEGKFGFIDKGGEFVIPPRFESASKFSEGLAGVEFDQGEHFFYIDQSGETVFQSPFDCSHNFSEGLAMGLNWDRKTSEDKYGYFDKEGKVVIPPQYIVAENFSEGLALVRRTEDECFGFINQQGEMVISPIFDSWCEGFSEGVASVSFKEKTGFIDLSGNWVIEPQYDSARPFSQGVAPVMVGEKWGLIDQEGKLVCSLQIDWFGHPPLTGGGEFDVEPDEE